MDLTWKRFERIESIGIIAVSLFAYFEVLNGSPILFLLLIMAPDLSMIGYLKDEKIGALVYNSFHNYLGPAILVVYSLLTGDILIQQIALTWAIHIAGDRTLGFGLKKPEGFKHTHLKNL